MKTLIAVCFLLVASLAFGANTPGQHNISLTWDLDPACVPTACGYNIYRVIGTGDPCANPGSGLTPYASSTTNAFLDTPVTAGQTYSYRVTEVLLVGGESACSTGVQPTVSNSTGKTPTGLQGSGH